MKHAFRPCSVDGCEGDARTAKKGARGWCSKHYTRWRIHGDPNFCTTPRWEATEWMLSVAVTFSGDDCLTWPFGKNQEGRAVIGRNGKKSFPVARWVCELVHGAPPTQKHHAAHSCGNGHEACVNPRHLRWATAKENFRDRVLHGTNICGKLHGMAKLTEDQVREIRRRRDAGEEQSVLAKEFGVVQSAISNIVNRKRWSHLDDASQINPNTDQEIET